MHSYDLFTFFSIKRVEALKTTKTLLKVMANAAIIGSSDIWKLGYKAPIAIGIETIL